MVRVDAPYWRAQVGELEDLSAVTYVWRNAVLAALVYTWGATAMFAIYSLSGLVWRHWWQYGGAMAIIAIGIFLYTYLLAAGRFRTRRALAILMGLTALQGIGVGVAFFYLILSGKLATPRDDWAANYLFTAGSFSLLVLSIVSILTYRRLMRRPTVT